MDRSLLRVVKALRLMGLLADRDDSEPIRRYFQRVAPQWLLSEAAGRDKELRVDVQRLLERERRRHPTDTTTP